MIKESKTVTTFLEKEIAEQGKPILAFLRFCARAFGPEMTVRELLQVVENPKELKSLQFFSKIIQPSRLGSTSRGKTQ